MTTEIVDLELVMEQELAPNEDDTCVVCWSCVRPKAIAGQLVEALCGRVDTYKDSYLGPDEEECPDCSVVQLCPKCGVPV